VNASSGQRQRFNPFARRSWTDLGPRIVSALVLLVITLAALYFGGFVFSATVGAVFAGCYREWERMVTLKPLTPLGGVLVGAVALSSLIYPAFGPTSTTLVIVVACLLTFVAERSLAVWRIAGLVFFGGVLIAVLAIRGVSVDGMIAGLFLGVVIFSTDTGAYFTGRLLGGEKMAPDISPGKTWSGALGGLVIGTIGGTIVWVTLTRSPIWIGPLLALVMSILGQLGDLSESAIKRRFRVKDSGDIIPGHGGLMDRLDSLTFGILFMFIVGYIHAGYSNVAGGFLHW
jgi:phosphatidate cytidylyltransferase